MCIRDRPVVVDKPVAAVVAPVAAKSEPVAPTAVEPKPAPVPAVMVTKPVERAPVKDSPRASVDAAKPEKVEHKPAAQRTPARCV